MSFLILDNVGYELESKTLFRKMTSPPDSLRKRIINDFIKQMKANGDWNRIDALWVLAAHFQQAARLNWKNPGTNTLIEVNAPSFVIDQGYTSNGTTSYLDTNFNASTQGTNYVQDSNSLFIYSRTNAQSGGTDMGNFNATVLTQLTGRFTDDVFYARLNNTSATFLSPTNLNSSGLLSIRRTSSTNTEAFRNGSSLATLSQTSSALVSNNIYVCCRNNNGTAETFTTRQYAVAGCGSGDINHLLLYNAIQQYMTSIGTQV